MKRRSLFFLILFLFIAGCTAPQPAETPTAAETKAPIPSQTVLPTAVPNELYVDPGHDMGPISPYIFGSNYGPWTAVPASLMQQGLNSHVTALRYPGGRWGDENDIQTYQLDFFMAFCQKMGATPTISVRFQDSTPDVAAALVRYANIEKNYNVIYWSIGNEPDYENLDGKKIDPVYFSQQWRLIAQAMKAVDPRIKLMGPELSQWGVDITHTAKYPPIQTPSTQARTDWMTTFLKTDGDLVDIVTVHRYPMYAPNSASPITVEQLRQNTLEWGPMVNYLESMIHDITGRDIPVAFTEVNSDPSNITRGEATPDSFYNAIWYADVLGRLITKNVFMVNQFVLGGNVGGLPLLYPGEIRPTYYVYQMYSHFGSERVYSVSGKDFVTVYAASRPDGTLTIMVINLTDSAQQVLLKVEGKTLSGADVWLFDASHNAVDLGQQAFSPDGALALPAQSITIYVLTK